MKSYLINFLRIILPPKEFVVPSEHVVMFEGDGKSINPKGNIGKSIHAGFWNYDKERDDEYLKHLELIDSEMDRFYSSPANKDKKKKKILVFIHGGLNNQVGSLKRVVEHFESEKSRCELIKGAGYYPIFINWRSSLFYCYWEHLIWLRQGKKLVGLLLF